MSKPRVRVHLAALVIAAGLAASCASDPSAGDGLRLDALAQREAARADPLSTKAVPAPPGVPDSLLEPATLGPTARTPLDEALRLAAAREVDLPSPPPGPALSDSLRLSAARMYTQARAAMLADRADEAAELYGKVVAIDPHAGEAWSALAAIRAAQGDQPAALEAWRSVLAVSPDDARALEQLGLAAYRRADYSTGLTLLARARENSPESVDPALPYLLDAALAEAFERSGSLRAAADAAERAASAPAPFDRPTSEQRRLIGLLRQRGLLLRGAGDMRLKLGDPAAAADAYLAALELEEGVPGATLARAVYAQRLLGADASAAHTVVDALERSGGRIEALDLRLVQHLSESLSPRTASAFAEALPGVAERGRWDDSPGARSAAARLAAAGVRDPQRAAALLLEHIHSVGADDAATEQLARTLGAHPGSLAAALTDLVARNPVRATQFVALFARAVDDRAAFETALETLAQSPVTTGAAAPLDTPAAARLARAWLALGTGGVRGAERSLERFRAISEDSPAARFAAEGEVEALLALGRTREAFDRADTLADSSSPIDRLLAGAVNAHLQRHGDAFSMLRAVVDDEALPEYARTDALLLAARAAATVGQIDAAERWLRAALEESPLREDAYAGLIQIGLANVAGNADAQAQLADVVRRLRETIPTSRTLRLLQAREYATQGQPATALEILADLLALDPRDESAQEQYVSTLMSANEAARAEAWLRERMERDDAEPTTAVLLARVLAATDRADDAQRFLTEAASRFPRSEPILRERESILRGPLNDPVAADEFALERLRAAPPTVENLLELAEVYARLGQWTQSAESLEQSLSLPGVTLRRDQNDRLARVIGLFAASADEVDTHTARLVADAAGLLAESPGRAPDVVHRARVALLLRAEAPVSELLDATAAPAPQNRDLALQLRLIAVGNLQQAGKTDEAFALARDGTMLGREIAPEMISARVALAVQLGRPQEAIDAIRIAAERGAAGEAYAAFMRLLGGRVDTPPTADEFAYMVAQFFGQARNDDGADALYLLALEFNPNHPWAANNYGYGLVERGEDLLRGYDLLQRAYAQLDTEIAVIDSLGWARYRVGVLEDTTNAHGERIEGAITLLEHAASLATAASDYMIHDHLGDALWRAGRRRDAVGAWEFAVKSLANEIADREAQAAQGDPDTRASIEAYLETIRSSAPRLRDKIAAVNADEEPELPEVFPDLREPALNIPVPAIVPARPGA